VSNSRRAISVLLSILVVASCTTYPNGKVPTGAQITPLNFLPALAGDYFEQLSTETGRRYHIYVRLPESYSNATSTVRYPVVYLLDGDSSFPLLATEHLFLHIDENLPEAIIVGIAYGHSTHRLINAMSISLRPSMV
jgi:uncharacterized protein